jgi:hypothetical protein
MNQVITRITPEEVGQFENQLKIIFSPIQPDSGYVQKLKEKLIKKTEILIEQDNPAFYLLLVIFGLIVGIISYLFFIKKSE